MISIILYGRNDSYGYNLHKRAVMSLNCMAAVLSDDDDEILFVDYNTPDDLPTFPEAVYDNLTDQARAKLRVLRVRGDVHQRHAGRTHLVTNEPLARNIALRRSNPANRWILATNTDLIFAPQHAESLTDIVRTLPDGIHCTPRIEIPETLWETLDRRDPRACIDAVMDWGSRFHLNEIVYGVDDILFDAPGDFQLMLRQDLFDIDGFDERMTLGWHVDSNISRRLRMLYGRVGDLSGAVLGYHCDHTRQITPMHRHGSVQNDLATYVDEITEPALPLQRATWGAAGEVIEEISLKRPAGEAYIAALSSILREPLTAPLEAFYRTESFDQTLYSPEHVLPFLVDMFYSAPRDWSIGWVGIYPRSFELFRKAWVALGFSGEILVYSGGDGVDQTRGEPALAGACSRVASLEEIENRAQAIVFEFTDSTGGPLNKASIERDLRFAFRFALAFRQLVTSEREHVASGRAPRRLIGLNAIHNAFERVIGSEIAVSRTPFSLRLRHGFVLPETIPLQAGLDNWLSHMRVGPAGVREDNLIRANGERGHIAFGPYALLWPGVYRLTARFSCAPSEVVDAGLIVEIVSDDRYFLQRELTPGDLLDGQLELQFEVAEADCEGFNLPEIEFRLWTRGTLHSIVIEKVWVDQLTATFVPMAGALLESR
jgi:hypothetical protein